MHVRTSIRGLGPRVVLSALLALLGVILAPAGAQGQERGHGAQASNMRLLGHDALQGRSAYQPVIHRNPVNGRWIAYVGHHGGSARNALTGQVETNGTSIVDVTDETEPRYLHHIPGPGGAGEAGGAQMVRVCNGRDLPDGDPGRVYMLRTHGNEAHQIWDVTRPAAPTLLTTVVGGLLGTHKNYWECDTGIAYLVSGVPGWATNRMMQVFDLSDPAAPVHIRDFGLPGQQPGGGQPQTSMHGPISAGGRVYVGYGTNANGVMQILDRERLLTGPEAPTSENLLLPQISRLNTPRYIGAHTTFPVLGVPNVEDGDFTEGRTRDIVVLVNESLRNECVGEAHQQVFLVDTTDVANPMVISNYRVPEAEGNFCERGGRFGAHSSNESMAPLFYRKVVLIAYFNAGVRAVDIRNVWRPREIGHYIPATTANTDERCVTVDGAERCKVAIQTNNVEVDDRGLVYAVDRANTGMHILRLTGEAAAVLDE